MIKAFVNSLYFLTYLVLPKRKILLEEVGQSAWAFPLVGFFIGLLVVGSNWLFSFLFSPLVRAILILILWIAVTGALHLDGFADCCDALIASKPQEIRLKILRDIHLGTFGVVGIVLLILAKFTFLVSCLEDNRWIPLILAPTLGRWAMVYAIVVYPTARSEGIGKTIKENTDRQTLLKATIFVFPVLFIKPTIAIFSFVLTWVFTMLFASWVLRRIPGFTGDVYGALCELVEAIVLLLFAV